MLPVMVFMGYVIGVMCSLKCFGTCSKSLVINDSYEGYITAVSKRLNKKASNTQKANFSTLPVLRNSTVEYFVEEESLTSDPLFENASWNISGSEGLNRNKRAVPEGRLTYENKMEILQLHNMYRRNVTPPASNMAFMDWDEELEKLAQKWADKCVFEHHMPKNNYPERVIGQNLYMGTDPTGYSALYLWYEEYHFYNFNKNSCLPNEKCGHYKQMAWSASTRLGCAMNKCFTAVGTSYFLACHYAPGVIRDVSIYRVGKPCSQCPSKDGVQCSNNLCLTPTQCEKNPCRCELECHNCGHLNKKKCVCECLDGWDSPDCSHKCDDKHKYCGKSPGWPPRTCYRREIAEKHCRKMCGMCQSVPSDLAGNKEVCCSGKLCDEGYVLDTSWTCRCILLCPGPHCNDASSTAIPLLASWMMIFWLGKVLRRPEV